MSISTISINALQPLPGCLKPKTAISLPLRLKTPQTLSLTLCISVPIALKTRDRKSTRLNSSHVSISYAVFCLKKKKEGPRTNHGTRRTSSEERDAPTRRRETASHTAQVAHPPDPMTRSRTSSRRSAPPARPPLSFFSLHPPAPRRHLHSFPTRRSSDLSHCHCV